MTTPCPIQHARLASALVQTLIAIDTADTRRASLHLRRFLNRAVAIGVIDMRQLTAMTVLLLDELETGPDKDPNRHGQLTTDTPPTDAKALHFRSGRQS